MQKWSRGYDCYSSFIREETNPLQELLTSVTMSISPGMVLYLCLNSIQHREASPHYQRVQTTQPLETARLTRLYVLFFAMSICTVYPMLFSSPHEDVVDVSR